MATPVLIPQPVLKAAAPSQSCVRNAEIGGPYANQLPTGWRFHEGKEEKPRLIKYEYK